MSEPRKCEDMGLRFRKLIGRPQGLFGFGVANALDAALAEERGAECIYAGGYSIALAKMLPDMGQMTMLEEKAEVEAVVRAVNIPVIADIDDGYGNALNVLRTVSEFLGREHIDFRTDPWTVKRLAGFHIEDQVYPKRCGHIAGKEVVPLEVAAEKIHAAYDVRNALAINAVIIARTDAYHSGISGSMEEAVKRGRAYAAAGADMVWCEFNKPDRESAAQFAEGMRKPPFQGLPLAFNYSPSLAWFQEKDPMTFEELAAMGYKFIFITIAAAHASSFAASEYAKDILERGAEALWEFQEHKEAENHPTKSHHQMARVPMWHGLERKYTPGAKERQEKSEGFKG